MSKLYYATSEIHGYGVFSEEDINEGDVLEEVPVIELPKEQVRFVDQTLLYDYYYGWADDNIAIALGFGSLYNHSYKPNAYYERHFESKTIRYIALTFIGANQEITTNYNGNPEDQTTVWFDK